MKNFRHSLSAPTVLLTLFCSLAWVALGQQPPPAAPPEPPASPGAPAAADEPPAPAAAPSDAPAAEPGLRRIDEPDTKTRRRAERRGGANEMPMGDHRVGPDSKVRELVSIMGSSTVEGEVATDAVSVLGNTTIARDGKVGGSAVAVLGRLDVQGAVGDEAVSVLGGSNIDGTVGGEAVSVLGDMRLGPNAVINGNLVVVGGRLTKEPGAIVRGDEVNVPFIGGFGDMEWLTTWLQKCALMGRPLAFGENLGWAWIVALSFLALYVLLGLLFPTAIDRCVDTLNTRPGGTIVASVLSVLLTPVVLVLLIFTVVGALLVPFVIVGIAFAALFGKAVMLAWLGGRIARVFTGGPVIATALAVLIGGVIVLALYVVPVLGFLVFKVLGWLGLGVVVYTVALRMKSEKAATRPQAPVVPPVPGPVPGAPPAGGAVAAMSAATPGTATATRADTAAAPVSDTPPAPVPGTVPAGSAPPDFPLPLASPGFTGAGGAAAVAAEMPAMPPPPPTLPPGAAATLPRATLMIRLGALFLDVVLVGLIVGFLSELLPRAIFRGGPPGLLLALAIYGAIMWKLKGSTIGGIICGLKVVRLDGREIDWATSIVRALGCFLSLVVAGLGFIWIAIDDDRQSWHDKIAGTVVVRVPKGVSLL